ncbi:hypothetical protein GCM10027414_07060 [Humibacter ginsengiterrae]
MVMLARYIPHSKRTKPTASAATVIQVSATSGLFVVLMLREGNGECPASALPHNKGMRTH